MSLASVVAATDYVELLTHTCTVQRPTATATDEGGHRIVDYTVDVDTLVVCRPDPIKSGDLIDIGGHLVQADYRLFLLYDQATNLKDRITDIVDSDGVMVAGTFEVLGKPDNAGAQGHHKEVLIRAVN